MKSIKKLLACVCALSVMACLFVGINVSAAYSGAGAGTETDPYIVANADQLKEAVQMGPASTGAYFRMSNDIVINEGTIDGYQNALNQTWGDPMTNGNGSFRGIFDGNGYVISGAHVTGPIDGSSWNYGMGLFQNVGDGAVIKNLGVENSFINTWGPDGWGYSPCGGIIGTAFGTVTVENCYVGADVILCGVWSNGDGGIVGMAHGTVNIKNCYTLASEMENGSVGRNQGGTVNVSGFYTTAPATEGTVENCYNAVTAKGDDAKTAMPNLDWEGAFHTVANEFPRLNAFIKSTITFDVSAASGAEVIEPMVVPYAQVTLPDAPEGYHWMNGTAIATTVKTNVDITLTLAEHSGGTATCVELAVCECGVEYGDYSTTHGETTLVGAEDADCSKEGYTGDKVCQLCEKVVEEGEKIDKTTDHVYDEGLCVLCGAEEPVKDNLEDDKDIIEDDKKDDATAPQTGESNTVILWVAILALNVVAAALLLACKKRMTSN